jgi:hypothetical protein
VSNTASFDILSPKSEKIIIQETNKLIDSLDNFNLMYPVNNKQIVSNDKRDRDIINNNNKLIQPDNEEQKYLNKKSDDNRRRLVNSNKLGLNNQAGTVTMSTGQNVNNINNIILNANFNCGLASTSAILTKDKKTPGVIKLEKSLKSSSNTATSYGSNKIENFGITKSNVNPTSKINSTKRTKG